MRERFKIEWTGTTSQTLEDVEPLGIQLGPLTLRNLGVDEWPLTIPSELGNAIKIPPRAVVTVWRLIEGEYVRVFTGEAGETAEDWQPDKGAVQNVTLRGPWHQLTKSIYERGDLDETLNTTGMPLPPRASYSWDFLKEYMEDYLSSWVSWPSFASTGLNEVFEVVVYGLAQTSLSANVQAVMSNYPRGGIWWDYSSEIPVANVARYSVDAVTIARSQLKSLGKLKLNDNYPDAVVLRKNFPWSSFSALPTPIDIPYWIARQCSTGFEKTLAQSVYPTGKPIAGPNILPITQYWVQFNDIPIGGDVFVFNTLSARYVSGTFVLSGIRSDVRPGRSVNLAETRYSAANMAVQSVTLDWNTDETTVEVGVHTLFNGSRAIDRLRAWFNSRFSWAQSKFPGTLIDPELPV